LDQIIKILRDGSKSFDELRNITDKTDEDLTGILEELINLGKVTKVDSVTTILPERKTKSGTQVSVRPTNELNTFIAKYKFIE